MLCHFQKDKSLIGSKIHLAWRGSTCNNKTRQEEGEEPKHTAENLMANDLQVSAQCPEAPCHPTS